jgi:uncharacterized protein
MDVGVAGFGGRRFDWVGLLVAARWLGPRRGNQWHCIGGDGAHQKRDRRDGSVAQDVFDRFGGWWRTGVCLDCTALSGHETLALADRCGLVGWSWHGDGLGLHQWAWRVRLGPPIGSFFGGHAQFHGRWDHHRDGGEFHFRPRLMRGIEKDHMMNTKNFTALAAGLIFALGLVLSGMTQPAKVLGFLNVMGLQNGISWQAQPGYWDPSLALVMGGALAVTLIAFAFTPSTPAAKPWFDEVFHLPTRNDIDTKLIVGGVMFGVGWGLAGYCPGPALASLLIGGVDALAFCAAMLAGMWAAKKWLV